MCTLEYDLFDSHLCQRASCLDCDKLTKKDSESYSCNIFRAQYERKKASIQETRYEQAKELAAKTETKELTIKQIENLAITLKERWLDEDRINVQRLRIALQDEYGVNLSNNRAYKLKIYG